MNQEEKIFSAIRGKGYTLSKAAGKLGVSRTTLYSYASKKPLDPDFVGDLKEKLGVDLDNVSSFTQGDLEAENAHLRAELEKARKRIDELTDAILRITEKK